MATSRHCMPYTAASVVRSFGVAFLILLAPRLLEQAVAAPTDVKGAVAVVVTKGVLPRQGNAQVSEQGTGFFISSYGYLVTSYHLKHDLGDVDEGSVVYEVHIGGPLSPAIPARVMAVNPAADIMVLYAPVAGENVNYLKPAHIPLSNIMLGVTQIFSVGYPQGYGFTVDPGVIRSFQVLSPPLPAWTTNLAFKVGESGSPIMLSDNSVIAIAMGADADDASIGLVVPIKLVPAEYWGDSLGSPDLPAGDAQPARIVVQADVLAAPTKVIKEFSLRNANCEGSVERDYKVFADPDTSIDTSTIQITALSSVGNTSFKAVDTGPEKFTVAVTLTNTGSCVQSGGVVTSNDQAAAFVGRVAYTQKPTARLQTQLITVFDGAAVGNATAPLPKIPQDQLLYTAIGTNGQKIPFKPAADELTIGSSIQVLNVQKALDRVFQAQ